MKISTFLKWSLAVAVAVLPLIGCAQKTAPAAVISSAETPPIVEADTNGPAPDPGVAVSELENAPGQIVAPAQVPTDIQLSATAAEVVKLAQAGVDESVMLAYVTNSTYVFALSSDDIIYLNDVGVPESVVTAMLQRDQSVRSTSAASTTQPPVYTNQLVPAPGAPTPYPQTTAPTETQPEETQGNYVQEPQPANVSYTYFYDTLSPYGTWIDIEGYGRCWQPTVVVADRGWQPYSDRGHWIYTDAGWYWASDYSWGWAPFHYGRWFRHNRWGWCWAPDTVWGPSWVSWRYTSDYCGWAPLPPTACYLPGFGFTYYGRSVGLNFSFGLGATYFTFVPFSHFYDRHPYRYRMHHDEVTRIFHNTTVMNRFEHDHDRVINRGIPVDRVASAAHTEIRPVRIREMNTPARPRLERRGGGNDRTLAIYRPNLPQPEGRPTRLVGEGVRTASRDFVRHNPAPGAGQANRPAPVIRRGGENGVQQRPARETRPSRENVGGTVITRSNPREQTDTRTRDAVESRPDNSRERTAPLIGRGTGRTAPVINPDTPANPTAPVRPSNERRRNEGTVGRPANPVVQPPQAQPPQPPAPSPNTTARTIPNRQFRTVTPQVAPTPAPAMPQPERPNVRVFRQENPRTRIEQPNITTRVMPSQRQMPSPVYQAPRPAEQQPMYGPPVERSAPIRIPQEQRVMPRTEYRSAPAPEAPRQIQSSPPPQQRSQSVRETPSRSDDNNSRRNR